MNRQTGQRQRTGGEWEQAASGDGGDSLVSVRAEVDRLLDLATRSFDQLSEGDSREFLRASEQTGGQ